MMENPMQSPATVADEDKQMRRLRIIVDLTALVLAQERMTVDEALDLMNATRKTVLRLFPGKEEAYDIIYGRRFQRILRERFASAAAESPGTFLKDKKPSGPR
jgi:AcrR family transcriptional regulator